MEVQGDYFLGSLVISTVFSNACTFMVYFLSGVPLLQPIKPLSLWVETKKWTVILTLDHHQECAVLESVAFGCSSGFPNTPTRIQI